MFDLFNKKKLKKLEEEKDAFKVSKDNFCKLYNFEKDRNKEIQENINCLINENQKLIDWIMNILDTFGTMEVRDRRSVQIPVCKEMKQVNFNSDMYGLHEREIITIPEIRIVKMG